MIIGGTRFTVLQCGWIFKSNSIPKCDLPKQMVEARKVLHDFAAIFMRKGRSFRPEDMLDIHLSNTEFLRQNSPRSFMAAWLF